MTEKRAADHPIEPLILNRWSPRSLTGEAITDETLFTIFEAARWAPSAYNSQPWRIIYAKNGDPHWNLLFNLLVDFNKNWVKNASALILIYSATKSESGKPMPTHSFDTGAAWQNMALQATSMGFIMHGMSGFDYEKAAMDCKIPSDFQIEAMAAIGRRAPIEDLAPEMQKMEHPSTRNPLSSFLFQGTHPIKKAPLNQAAP